MSDHINLYLGFLHRELLGLKYSNTILKYVLFFNK